ncbi:hypothetical protein K0M31_010945 [Melipona bicolor]|uniref:Uncharacterized protein n=1 Tax=Melipona bicolor TaxID=60889 RepID=A0AA40FKL2_9HYME|nr:hypothetical protein K0M31_010945 [Melipona bicolor]
MRFFDCSRCLTSAEETGPSFVTTDPLVAEKPPSKFACRSRSRGKKLAFVGPGSRFMAMVRSLRASWKRNGRRNGPRTRLEMGGHRRTWKRDRRRRRAAEGNRSDDVVVGRGSRQGYGKDVAGKIEPRSGILAAGVEAAGLTNGSRLEDGNGSGELGRRQLEREYSEQLEALKFLVEPPACFRNVDEARQNLENKLNTLDLKRMNTVAIPTDELTAESVFTSNPVLRGWSRGRMKNCGGNGFERMFQTRNSNFQGFCAGTVDDTRLNIERTVIDLFVRAPILKTRKLDGARRGVLFNANEGKTVRFKDEHDDAGEMLDEKESGERSAKNISLRETSEEMKNCELLEGTDVIDGIDRSEVSMNDGRTEELVRFDGNFDPPFDVAVTNGMVSIDYP